MLVAAFFLVKTSDAYKGENIIFTEGNLANSSNISKLRCKLVY